VTPSAAQAPALHHGPLAWALLLTLVVLWGSAFALVHVALESFHPMAITAGRLAVGAAVLLAFAWLTGRALPRRAATWRLVSAIAVLGNALPFFLISWGQQRIPSGLAGILMAVMPLAVLVLAHFLVPGERLTGRRLGGFLLGFAGVAVLTGPEALAALAGGPGGLVSRLAVLCGALCYAVSTILARRGAPEDAVTVSAGVMIVAEIFNGRSRKHYLALGAAAAASRPAVGHGRDQDARRARRAAVLPRSRPPTTTR
jgi:drug/metabolite transporter (DMT)-like permease